MIFWLCMFLIETYFGERIPTLCHLEVAHIWYYYQIPKRQLMFLEISIYLIVIFILPFLKSKVGRPDFWINALLLLHDKVPDTNRPICNEPGKKIKQRIGRGQIESSDAGRRNFLGVPAVKGGQNVTPLVGIGLTFLQNIGGGTVPPGPPVPASMESMQPELYRWASFASCSSHTNGFITLALGKPGRAPSRTFCRKKLWYSRICSFSFGLHQSADDGFDAHSGSGPCPLACSQPTN